jgi:signal transduction histidine kinase
MTDPLRAALQVRERLRATLETEVVQTRLLVDETLAGWWRWDVEQRQGTFSAGLKERLGLDPQAPLDARNVAAFGQALDAWQPTSGAPFDAMLGMTHRDGHTLWLHARGEVSARDADGRPQQLRGVHFDLTRPLAVEADARSQVEAKAAELAQLNATLKQQADQLARSNAALEDFAYAASHDLQTPLRAIAHFATWIDEDLPPDTGQEVRQHVARLLNRVERLAQLHRDLLAYARVNHTPVRFEPTDLAALVRRVWDGIDAPGFDCVVGGTIGAQSLPVRQIRDILCQVLTNAVQHHDAAPGRVTVRLAQVDDRLRIEVEDDGPGIEPRFGEQAFKVLETLRPRDEGAGSGVGLSIARRHAERIGGRVTLAEREGRGACFVIEFPGGQA